MAEAAASMKNKRKSHLKCGRRRSKSLGGILPSGLSKAIPTTLPPEERLQSLFKSAFEHCLITVGREFCGCEDFDLEGLLENGSKCYQEVEQQLIEEKICNLAVAAPVETDENSTETLTVEKYETSIEKLQEECNKWDEILSSEREELEKQVEKDSTSILGEYEASEKMSKYDYTKIINDADSMSKDLNLLVDSLSEATNTLSACLKLSNKYLNDMKIKSTAHFDEEICETPRTLLGKVASAQSKH